MRMLMSSHSAQSDVTYTLTRTFLLAFGAGLMACALQLATEVAIWLSTRRMLGEGLETTANAWSLAELNSHIREIEKRHAETEGRAKARYARHLAWLEARRDLKAPR
jgi:hypothetical protein